LNQWHSATEKEIILTTANISSGNTKKKCDCTNMMEPTLSNAFETFDGKLQ
jgi:hypothetical protein